MMSSQRSKIHGSRAKIGLVLIALVIVGLDQLTKAWVTAGISSRPPFVVVEGLVRLRYTQNTGAAFGILQGWTGALSIAAVAVIVAIIVSASRIGHSTWGMISLGLLVGGAVGNLIDRVRLGYVVDFVDFYGPHITLKDTIYTFPVFNVADSAITVGTILLLLLLLFGLREPAPQEQPPTPDTPGEATEQQIAPSTAVSARTTPVEPSPAGWAGLAVLVGGIVLMALRAATRRT